MDSPTLEQEHQDTWYREALANRFFEREGFRRLVTWNLRLLRDAIPFERTMYVLSLGCGLGDYELALASDVERIVAVDLSAVAVEEARRRARNRGVDTVEFRAASLNDLSFPPATFDVVVALGTLHHLSDVERGRLLSRLRDWLKPAGWFYARDPNARGTLRMIEGLWHGAAFHSPNERALDPRRVAAEISAAGLSPLRTDYSDVLAGPVPWVLPVRSSLLWSAVLAFDRAWLAVPGLRSRASQFSITARR